MSNQAQLANTITAEYRSTCPKNLRDMFELKSSCVSHTDLQPSRIRREEGDVESVVDILEN